jgi:hypothetical protein
LEQIATCFSLFSFFICWGESPLEATTDFELHLRASEAIYLVKNDLENGAARAMANSALFCLLKQSPILKVTEIVTFPLFCEIIGSKAMLKNFGDFYFMMAV